MAAPVPFKGFLEPSIEWGEEDDLVLQPVFLVPVEVFRTGFLTRPEYKTVVAIVEAVGGKVQFIQEKKAPRILDPEPEGSRLPANIPADRALRNAESAAVTEGREGWRALSGSSHVMAREEKMKACWKVWVRHGETLTDSINGNSMNAGELLGLLLPQAPGDVP